MAEGEIVRPRRVTWCEAGSTVIVPWLACSSHSNTYICPCCMPVRSFRAFRLLPETRHMHPDIFYPEMPQHPSCRKSRHFVLGLPPAVNTLPPAPTHSPVFHFFAVSHNSSRTHQDCSMCSHLDNAWHWHERALALCRSPHFSALSTHFHLFLCSRSA